jgi:epoxyqueuosine reductase
VIETVDRYQLAALIKQKAKEIGFDLVGIASAEKSSYESYVRDWLATGKGGEMRYLSDRLDERLDPRLYFPEANTVVCVALNYHAPLPEENRLEHPARFARYTLGNDYHEHVKTRLHALSDYIRFLAPQAKTRASVDTAPVLERELAARAGIGWIGKNTCVINTRIGSWIFLGEVMTSLDLPIDAPAIDRCGTCTRCIEACPTDAITPPRGLDASRCISYLTIEYRGEIPPDLAARTGEWVFGCDICQDVCPWNRKAPFSILEDVQPVRPARVEASSIAEWSQEAYWDATRKSSMRRVKLPQFQRNTRWVLENARRSDARGD